VEAVKIVRRVADKSVSSWQQVVVMEFIWETTRHNRHNGLLSAPTNCCGLLTDLQRGTYGEAMGKLTQWSLAKLVTVNLLTYCGLAMRKLV